MAGFAGLAGVSKGYNDAAEAYWKRRQAEDADAELAMLGRAFQAPMPEAQQVPPTPQTPILQAPRPPISPTQLNGLQPRPLPADFGTAQMPPGFSRPGNIGGQPQNYFTGTDIPKGGFNGLTPAQQVQARFPASPGGSPPGLPGLRPMPTTTGAVAMPGATSMMPTSPAGSSMQPPGPVSPQPGPGGPMQVRMQPQPTGPQTWENIVQRIVQANPGASPSLIAGAALKAVPLMQMLSQEQRQQIQDQLRQLQMQLQTEELELRRKTGEREDRRLNMLEQQQSEPTVQAFKKQVEDYEITTGQIPARIRGQVEQALREDQDSGATTYKGEPGRIAFGRFTNPDTPTGKIQTSIQTINQHLDTWKALADGKITANSPIANSLINWYQKNFPGAAYATTLDQVKQYIGGELVRSVTGIPGTGFDREKAEQAFGPNASPQQKESAYKAAKLYISEQKQTQQSNYKNQTGRTDYNERWPVLTPPAIEKSTVPNSGKLDDMPFTVRPSSSLMEKAGTALSYLNPVSSAQAMSAEDPLSRNVARPGQIPPVGGEGGAGGLIRQPTKSIPLGGRSMATEPLRIGRESAVLEAGAQRAIPAAGPSAQDWDKLERIVKANSFAGDALDTQFKTIKQAVDRGMSFRQAMYKYGSRALTDDFAKILRKSPESLGIYEAPENVPEPFREQ